MLEAIQNIDVNILYYIQDHLRTPFLNDIVPQFTSLGNAGLIWIVIVICLLLFKKTGKTAKCSVISMLLCLLTVNLLIKNIVARVRPYDAFELVRCIIPPARDYSFPSGHTAIAWAAMVPVCINLGWKAGLPAVIAATLMSLSRLYVCVHYPSDVIAGFIIGTACALISCKLIYPAISGKIQRAERNEK